MLDSIHHMTLTLRNRFTLTVICCLIYHWLEVSHQSG